MSNHPIYQPQILSRFWRIKKVTHVRARAAPDKERTGDVAGDTKARRKLVGYSLHFRQVVSTVHQNCQGFEAGSWSL